MDQVQRLAQSLLHADAHPVCTCQRNTHGGSVGIKRRADGSGARFEGLITCGDVHVCLPCSAKVSEERRLEMILARNRWLKEGGECLLMTLTFPHEREHELVAMVALFAQAIQRFKNSRTWKRVLGTLDEPGHYGRIGSVKSLEETLGAHGWHVHVHEVIFCRRPGLLNDSAALDELRYEWVRILLKVGLGENSKRNDMLIHAFDMTGGDYAADYILKYGRQPQLEQWGIIDEVTKSHAKSGMSKGHLTPFGLLRAYGEGDEQAGAKFVEFARAFKHKRALTWSPGLKKYFGIADASDEELARAPMVDEEDVCRVDRDDWALVLSRNARGELRFWAAKEGEPGVRAFLAELRERPRSHSSSFATGRRWDSPPFVGTTGQVMHRGFRWNP